MISIKKIDEDLAEEYKMRPCTVFQPPVYYPASDGKPVAETDIHISQLTYLREALRDYFRDDPKVYVSGNLFFYYEEDDPTKVVAPDVFVVKGVAKRDRRIYQLWKEYEQAPDVVFELTSWVTRQEDLGLKKGLYEVLGVEEYFLFDAFGEYLEPRLIGLRLGEWSYRRMEEVPLVSQVLGLELRVEGDFLRLVDLATGEKLLTSQEVRERHRRAEAEVARLQAELARLQDVEETKEDEQ